MALVVSFKPVAKPPVPHHAQASASSSFSQRKLEIFLRSREHHLIYSNFFRVSQSSLSIVPLKLNEYAGIWRFVFLMQIAFFFPWFFIFKLSGTSVSKSYWFLKIYIRNFEQVIFWLISLNFLGIQTCHVEILILLFFFSFTIFARYFFLEWLSADISRARLNKDGNNGTLLFCFQWV